MTVTETDMARIVREEHIRLAVGDEPEGDPRLDAAFELALAYCARLYQTHDFMNDGDVAVWLAVPADRAPLLMQAIVAKGLWPAESPSEGPGGAH